MRLVDLHLDIDRPLHLELHERLTVIVADDAIASRVAGLLGRAYVLAGGEVRGTLDGGGYLTPFDPTAVVALALVGDGLRTVTPADLPAPDPTRRLRDRERAVAELVALEPEVTRLRLELDQAQRVHDATVAATAAGTEELATATARREDLAAATRTLEERPPEIEREHDVADAAIAAAEARVSELVAVRADLDDLPDVGDVRAGDDLSALAALADRAATVGGLGPSEHAAVLEWCAAVGEGRAAVHPDAQALIDETSELESAWEAARAAGVEGDPEVLAAVGRRDGLQRHHDLLAGLARSGHLGDTARNEIEQAHVEVVGAKGQGRDAALVAEDEALARYGFDSHLEFTIAMSTRSVGQQAESKLRSVTAELARAEEELDACRSRAAARLEELADRREPVQERITTFLGFRPDGPAVPLLAAVPAVPREVAAIGEALDDAAVTARDEVRRYREERADLDEEARSLGDRRDELVAQQAQMDERVVEIEEVLARVEDQADVAAERVGAATEALRHAAAARSAAARAVDELDDVTVDAYTAQDVPTVVEALVATLAAVAPNPEPVLLHDALAPLGAGHAADALAGILPRVAATQLVYLTGDPAMREWAEHLEPTAGRCVVLGRSRWAPRRLVRRARSRSRS